MGLMLVVQQNCKEGYKYTISTLKTKLILCAGIVFIQEPFLERKNHGLAELSLYLQAKNHDRKDN